MFDVDACKAAANIGSLDDWVHSYLNGGPWANVGLSEGLRRQRRYWLGPILLPPNSLERCCGPEPEMEYRMPADGWRRRVTAIADSLVDARKLPPLIVEWRAGTLSIRDGSHRHAAMVKTGWHSCWVIIWCNSANDFEAAEREMAVRATIPP